MGKYRVIAIERQYASGGKEIGKLVAEKLGIPFYNREILEMAAKKLGVRPENIEHAEESAAKSLLSSFAMMSRIDGDPEKVLPLQDRLFITESKIITDLTRTQSCVIVGRGAGDILREDESCLRVFIYADVYSRIERAVNEYMCAPEDAERILKQHDRRRSSFYDSHSLKKWSDMNTYDVCLNSGALGSRVCARTIIDIFSK